MKTIISLFGLFIIISFVSPAHANLQQRKATQLNKLNQQIIGLKNNLNHAKSNRVSLQQELKQIETTIGGASHQLVRLENSIQKQNRILKRLHDKENGYLSQLQDQRSLLGQEVNAAYKLGQHRYLKLLLNQHDPNTTNRMLVYYKYINQARIKFIRKIEKVLNGLKVNQQQIKHHKRVLQDLHWRQQRKRKQLVKKYQQRKQVLAKVSQTIKSKGQKLEDLLANKRALKDVITKLEATPTATYHPKFRQAKIAFKNLKGKLTWPAKGTIIKHYGDAIGKSGLINNAITIAAPIGEKVYAIYPGRVVFSDWLRGIGFLIIINHGHGFMTLYGHDNSLYKKVGDYVAAGTVIATVGKSGGYDKSGLYFQIRHNGEPMNPEEWLTRQKS